MVSDEDAERLAVATAHRYFVEPCSASDTVSSWLSRGDAQYTVLYIVKAE